MAQTLQHSSESNKPSNIQVLLVCGSAADCMNLRAILSHTNWTVHCAKTTKSAKSLLEMQSIHVVLCSTEFHEGTWEDVVRLVEDLPNPAKVVVFTSGADESVWKRIIETGAHDILTKPFDESDIYEVVSLAYHAWTRQTEGAVALAPRASS